MDDSTIRLRVHQAAEEKPYIDALNAFTAFTQSLLQDDAKDPKLNETTMYQLQLQLSRIENVYRTAELALKSQYTESARYDATISSADSVLEQVRNDISKARERLVRAKLTRARKEEHAAVLAQIYAQQSRDQSEKTLQALASEVSGLEQELATSVADLDLKRRQLALILHALSITVETEANDPANTMTAAGIVPMPFTSSSSSSSSLSSLSSSSSSSSTQLPPGPGSSEATMT